ncbi:hypothetical protein RZO07_14680 [Pseudomonas protegens]|uniref:hypothetical protein n=1 Tax=Pseudomonas protegens TaxID=380021 RepID=UPI0029371FFF|nr:hypothetical protein [Pseudomonas protegens]WOE82409.1 hypothetical protein RZO07_14680 [Pseudomonas protegens]
MSDRFLAFRCFGTFSWPPLRSVKPEVPAAEGVVEIHYVLDAKKAAMVGCARWVPRDTWKPDLEFTTSQGDIPPLPKTSDAAKTALKNAADKTHAWRFDQSGVVLAFEGVQVFVQYAVRQDQAGAFQQELDLRVALVREHNPSVSASHYKSRVLIGQDKNPCYGSTWRCRYCHPRMMSSSRQDERLSRFPRCITPGRPCPVSRRLRNPCSWRIWRSVARIAPPEALGSRAFHSARCDHLR